MPIFFDRFAAVADRTADAVFGGEVLIEPQLRGGYTGAGDADPDRPAKTVVGILTTKEVETPLAGQAGGETRASSGLNLVELRATVLKLTAEVAIGLGYDLQEGDRVTRLDRTRDNVFAVVDVARGDRGELSVNLVNA